MTEKIMKAHIWETLEAEKRRDMYDAAIEEFLASQGAIFDGLTKPLSPETFWIIKELVFGDSGFCENCEEQVPELLLYEADDDSLVDHPEKKAILQLNVEWRCCVECVIDAKQPRCENCGVQEHSAKRNPICKRWVDGEQVEFIEGHHMKELIL